MGEALAIDILLSVWSSNRELSCWKDSLDPAILLEQLVSNCPLQLSLRLKLIPPLIAAAYELLFSYLVGAYSVKGSVRSLLKNVNILVILQGCRNVLEHG